VKLQPGDYFMQGNEACVEAAVHAGIRFFAGYPITPSTEIAEGLAYRMPQEGGMFIQMEDEIASIFAVIGASWTGSKAMTATSGPGFSLMQEGVGYAAMTETPLVIVDVMRGGPSTGLPTMPGQGDIIQAKHGSQGDYPVIALAASSVQDMFDLTIRAFNLAESYRVPVVLLSDAAIGHMRSRFQVPPDVKVLERRVRTDRVWHDGFAYGESLVPKFPVFGSGSRVHVTGLSHDIAGYPSTEFEVHEELVHRLHDKIQKHRKDIIAVDVARPGSKKMIVTFGSPALAAAEVLRKHADVGLVDLKTIWPFPEDALISAIEGASKVLVVEMNLGQVFHEVQWAGRAASCDNIRSLTKVGGEVVTPEEIEHELKGEG
jgi:2-oxoglutarate/2-oxoacid ferredoxin oxidoreductase subunit alpha